MTTTARKGWLAWWWAEIAEHPILLGWLLIFTVHAGMNAKLGHELGGGEGLPALLYAGAFLGFAVVGAWAADQIAAAAGLRRTGLIAIAVLQLAIGQMAGWQALGLTLERGATTLEGKADVRRSTKDALDRARADVAAIGVTRAVEAIEADERLECTIRSAQYKDGVGPKCTRLRAELATARRKAKLEESIAALTGDLGAAPKVKNADAIWAAPQALAQGLANALAWAGGGQGRQVTPDDVRFGWMVFLVFALEAFGTFGLALIRNGSGSHPTPGAGAGHGGSGSGHYGGGYGPRPGGGPSGPAPTMRDAVETVLGGGGEGWAHRLLPAPPQHAALAYGGAMPEAGRGTAYAYGPPININVSSAPGPSAPATSMSATGRAGADTPEPDGSIRPAPATFAAPRRDLPALSADAPPVDRSGIRRELAPAEREAADVILAFRAACVLDTPGGIVSGLHLYQRYAAWAGERALDEPVFLALFQDVTGIAVESIGGLAHVRGIALRMGVKLEAVA